MVFLKQKNSMQFIGIVIVTMLLLIGFSQKTQAQFAFLKKTPMYVFDLPNSLRGNEVQQVFQDDTGYMWFATKGGLIQYDGTNFKTFSHSISDSTSISSNEAEVILQTKDGTLWIGTWGNGLNKFNRRTGTFTRFTAHKNGLSNNFIGEMVEDSEGYIWIATRHGLNRFDPKTETFKVFLPEKGNPKSISYYEVRTLYIDKNNTLWIGTGYPWSDDNLGGLNKYHPNDETFTRYLSNPNQENTLLNNKVTAIFEDSQANFWIGTDDNHTYLMDRKQGTFEFLEELSDWEIKDSLAQIRSFFEEEDGSIWLCSYGAGLKNYDLKKDKLNDYIYDESPSVNSFFPFNRAWKMFESNDGVLWFCTGSTGQKVYKSNRLLPYLGMVGADDIQAIHVNNTNGNIWLGRHYNGLNFGNWSKQVHGQTWFDDPKEIKKGNWWSSEKKDATQLFDNIFALHQDTAGWLWFGKKDKAEGLYKFHPETGAFQQFKHELNNPNSLAGNMITSITESPDGAYLWIVSNNGVLNRLDKKTATFKHYSAAEYANFPNKPYIANFSKDKSLWLGSIEGQKELRLTKFNAQKDQFTTYSLMTLSVADTTFKITNLVESPQGDIWLVTDRSLCKLTTDNQTFCYPVIDDKIGTIISCLADDKSGIWLATSTGISVFNTKTADFYTYSTDFEIPAMPFNFRSAALIEDELMFGGKGGCIVINHTTKEHYYNNQESPENLDSKKVLLAAFYLNGKEIKTGKYAIDSILVDRNLMLNYQENNFSFELSLLDFQYPDHNHFEYFLENYDNYWRKTGDKNTAYYSQIPPGNYTLRVKGYNVDGVYGEVKPLQITVLPPWWRTWWAYAAYTLLFGGLIYSFYRFQLNQQLAVAEAERLQDLDIAKSQLYTNITHEFRTPLTVILGMTKKLEGQVTESQNLMVEMINRNGQNLLNLVNQMLDLSKVESGQMTLQLQQSDMISYLKYLTESFHSFAESRGVKVHFLSDLESQQMDFDPHKIQQIISNLLSNAIKFTPYGGDIYISVQPKSEAREQLIVKIKDTGIGIEESRLPHIFQRFYQVDDSATRAYQGTGIGLALVAELVKLMKGKITAKSELGKGAEFTILLPIEQTAEQNQDLSYFDQAKSQFYREGIADDLETPIAIPVEEAQKPTILIVEDNFDVRTYIRACLSEKFHLLMAENGQRGVETAIQTIPDLIISDVMMPLKDGYSLVRELKNDKRTSHIPIVLLTAKADTDSRLQGLRQGVDAYLAKPFNPQELLIRIEKLMELRKKLQQHYLSLSVNENGATALETKEKAASDHEDEFVQQVKAIIVEHLDDYDLNVQMLCREIGMSHSQLHRKLSALTGLSTNRFIKHIRLTKAKELLRNPELSITAVAFDTGYSDPSYFGRVFKKETGMTPVEWQNERAQV